MTPEGEAAAAAITHQQQVPANDGRPRCPICYALVDGDSTERCLGHDTPPAPDAPGPLPAAPLPPYVPPITPPP